MNSISGVIVLMGPGRSGTTSLYHAFHDNPAYFVGSEKEAGAFSFSFENRRPELKTLSAQGVFVEATPSNLLASKNVVSNVFALEPSFARFIVIKRPVLDRMISLFRHHIKLGNFAGSLDEYIQRSLDFADSWTGWFDGSQNITFGGIAEYQTRLLDELPQEGTTVIEFSDLFAQTNAFLTDLGLNSIEEITRNEGFIPMNQVLHRPLVFLYRRFGLANLKGLEKLKSAYREFNNDTRPIKMSAANRCILNEVDKHWTEALARFHHAR
jgi:hypothetical protein